MAAGIITDRADVYSLENLYNAYLACRKRKRATVNCLRFEADLLEHLCTLRLELVQGSYHPSTSICFVQKRPKMREIFAADFRDRVVHHLLVGYLEPVFERMFIDDSYACRVGRGVHAGVARLRGFLNQVTANGTVRAWYLKEDIRGFFMSLDKELLYRLVCSKTKREQVRRLARTVIFHDCTGDYHFKGDRRLLERIPPHKSLFKVDPGKGLPIGNLTSQFFANVYLNELDQFVKRRLRCPWYLRYCDDFILLSPSRGQLVDWHERISEFLREKLLLELNPTQHRLRPVSSGIDWLGYIVRRSHILVRRRVVNHLHERLRDFEQILAVKKRGELVAWSYPQNITTRFRSTIASYWGHFGWADAHDLVHRLMRNSPLLRSCFFLDGDKPVPRFACPFAGCLSRQYGWWTRTGLGYAGNPKLLLFFPVGRFYEFYDGQALAAHKVLGLKLKSWQRGFRFGCGFHRRWLQRYLDAALAGGCHVALLGCIRDADGRVRRVLVKLFKARAGGTGFLPGVTN